VAQRRQIHFFADTRRFARRLAAATGLSWQGEQEAILVRSLHDPNRKLIEVLLAGDAIRRAGARWVTLVAPYLPYMRQDRVFTAGEPISQRVVGTLLGHAFDARCPPPPSSQPGLRAAAPERWWWDRTSSQPLGCVPWRAARGCHA
jgi:hypothetical protein